MVEFVFTNSEVGRRGSNTIGKTTSVNRTPTHTACPDAYSMSAHTLHSMITFHHAKTRASRAQRLRITRIGVLKRFRLPRVMSRSLPHLTLTTSTSSLSPISSTSPIFPTVSPLHTSPMILDPCIPCDVPRQSGGSAQIPSLTGDEPKSVENKAFDTEAIEPEDLEPRRIELDRNLGTDPYHRQERFMRNRGYGRIWKSWCRDVLFPVTDAFR